MLLAAALCLLGHINPSEYAGALTDPDALAKMPVEQMNQEQLKAELERLNGVRTSFVGPVVMAAVGGGVFLVGGVFFIYGALVSLFFGPTTMMSSAMTALRIVSWALMGVGAVMVVVGGIFLAIGLARLFPTLAARREAMERRDDVLKRLEGTAPNEVAPPPPPGPPADVWLFRPKPTLVLAEF